MFITISFEVLESGRKITHLTLPQMKDSPPPPRLKTIEIGETEVLVDINRETGCVFGLELTDEDAT